MQLRLDRILYGFYVLAAAGRCHRARIELPTALRSKLQRRRVHNSNGDDRLPGADLAIEMRVPALLDRMSAR